LIIIYEDSRKIIWYDLLSSIFSGADDPNFVVCKVTPNRIKYCAMNMPKPEIWQF